MNLTSGTYHFCERREYAFNVFPEQDIIIPQNMCLFLEAASRVQLIRLTNEEQLSQHLGLVVGPPNALIQTFIMVQLQSV